VEQVVRHLGVSERKACAVLGHDFVEDRTRDGRRFRMLCVVDAFSREALAIRVTRQLSSAAVIDTLADLFIACGAPGHIRSDQGPECVAEAVKGCIEKTSPWESGSVESFNGKLRDELLHGEVLNSLRETQVLIERWRRHDNEERPHSSLGCRPPAPEVLQVGHRPKPGGSDPGGATQVAERGVHQNSARTTQWGLVSWRRRRGGLARRWRSWHWSRSSGGCGALHRTIGKRLSAARRRACVAQITAKLCASECRILQRQALRRAAGL
jgi:hypothetical protein